MASTAYPRRSFNPEMSARYGRPTFSVEKLVKYSPKNGWARMFNFPHRGSHWRPRMHTAVISIDGACKANNASDPDSRAAWAVYFGPHDLKNRSGLVPPDQKQTNSRAALEGVMQALYTAQRMKRDGVFDPRYDYVELIIRLSSEYVQNAFNRDIWHWVDAGYLRSKDRSVAHLDLIQKIHSMICDMEQNMSMSVRFWRTERDINAQALAQHALDNEKVGGPGKWDAQI